MKARHQFTVLIFLVTVRFTEELTWNIKMRETVCCQGKKQLLIWNFTKGENERVTELHWFFNEKTLVCLESETTGFLVADLYEGRVERNGTVGIQLKNVSLNDTGEYTLYVKLEEEKERNVQGINLTVVEAPPNQCKPIIKKRHPIGIISCSTSCERSPLSLEWIINGTKDTGDIAPYFVVNSSGTSEQPICCLRDFKCLDDYQTKFCTANHFSFAEDMHTVNESVADTNHMVYAPILIIQSVILMILIIVVIACVILNRRRCRLFFTVPKRHYATNDDMEIELKEPFSVAVKPTHSNTVVQCNEDLQQVPTVAITTDRLLQDSNQHVQIVNNISIDTDFLKSITHANRALMAEIQAIRKETRKLKRQLHREKHLRPKYSFEMTPVKCKYFKKNDTDSSETSEWEDASPELIPL